MVPIGFRASHEQVDPAKLLQAVRDAESVGFDGAMCSDHLAPWTRAQAAATLATMFPGRF